MPPPSHLQLLVIIEALQSRLQVTQNRRLRFLDWIDLLFSTEFFIDAGVGAEGHGGLDVVGVETPI